MLHRRSLAVLLFLGACAPTIDDGKGDGLDTGATGDDGDDGGDAGDDGDDTGDPGPVDEDGDGWYDVDPDGGPSDCDDTDPDVHPGADEVEDGIDNDCDGFADELEVCEGVWASIQAALDAAGDGGVVQVCPGEYVESLSIVGLEQTLVGIEGAEVTTVIAADPAAGPLVVAGGADATVSGLSFTGGATENGGGVLCASSRIQLDAVALVGNTATVYGGGAVFSDCQGELRGSRVAGNTAFEGGGVFIYGGNVDVVGNEIVENEATVAEELDWGAGGGGGGLWTASSRTVSGNTIAGNISGYNGGGAFFYRVNADIDGNTFSGNWCAEDGGGLYFNVSAGTVSNNLIDGNEAADDGGGLRGYVGTFDVIDNVLSNNIAADDGGGAKVSHSTHEMRGNVYEGNSTGDAGGGLELDNDSSHVSDSEFRGNTARRGAGLHNWRTEQSFTIEDSVFEGNEASDCGGGLSFDNSPHTIDLRRLTVTGNAAVDGAGLCVDLVYRDPEDVGGQENYFQTTHLDIASSVFGDNTASDDGGGLYLKAARVEAHNVVIDGNSGPGAGAVAVKGSVVSLASSIVTDNGGGPVLLLEDTEDAGAGSLAVSYSDLWGNDAGVSGLADPVGADGNIGEDPDFTGAWALAGSSPCIDAGDPSVHDADGTRADMGMYGGPDAP